MSRIELNIVALGNFSNVNSEISALKAKVESLNKTLSGVGLNSNQIASVKNMVAEFDRAVMSTGQFSSKTIQLQSETEKFGKALEGGKLKLREYYNIISQGSKQAQGQLRALALEQTKLQNSLVISDPLRKGMATVYTPKVINEVTNATKIATNQQMLYNLALDRGSTSLINWGKNTQWAGRQLTVGLTVPLTIFGSAAAKVFQNMDAELVRMQKVYGTGLVQPTKEALASIRKDVGSLAKELANSWGVPITETAAMAADLAATGKTGLDLVNATREAIRLSKLGEVDRQQAMQATISLQNVYKLNTKQLSDAVNFLNAVENQTSTSLQDLVDAIPRVGPIVAQMGGSFKDTAAMMVAMKEAGVPAAQSANAIKAALASMINPTKAAREAFKAYGIDVAAIAGNNKGNAIGMLTDLQNKLKDLQPLAREQLVEKMFGKFQMSRITALLDNLNKVGSQSQTVFKLMGASSQQLSNMAQAELKVQTESTTGRYKRAIESLKADLVPIGEQFTKVITRLVQFGDTVVKFVDKLGPLKGVLGIILGFVAVAGPILMLTGVFGNLFGYIFKGIAIMRNLTHGVTGLKGVTGLLTAENIAAANASDLMGKKMIQEAEDVNILGNAITQLNLKLADMQLLMSGASITSPLSTTDIIPSTTIGSPYPKTPQTNASGLQFVHGTPAVILTEEQKLNLKKVSKSDIIKNREIRQGYTNIGFMAPPSINNGNDRMTGIEAASYFEKNAQVATSQLLEAIISTVPSAANNPAVRADMERLAMNLAAELRIAGTAAVSDPVFYGAVERALTKTLTTAAAETQAGIAAAQGVVKVATYGSNVRSKGERKSLNPAEQAAVGNTVYSRTWNSSSPNAQITGTSNTAIADVALLEAANAVSNINNTTPAPTSQAGAAVSKSGILSKIKSPKIGGGMIGMGAMMLSQMLGDKLPSGVSSTISAAGTGAMIGSFIPGIGTLAGAVGGAAVNWISTLMQKEKDHAVVAKATFSESAAAVSMFGGALNDVTITQHSFTDFKPAEQLSQMQTYITQIGKLNDSEPIKVLANSFKDQTSGKSIIGNLKSFAAAQVASGMDPTKVNDMIEAMLTYAGKGHLVAQAQKEIGAATKDVETATVTWIGKLRDASGGISANSTSYNHLSNEQKAYADGLLLVMNRILDVNAPLKTIEANLQAIGEAAGSVKEKYTALILAAQNAGDMGLVKILNNLQSMNFNPGAAAYITKIVQSNPDALRGYSTSPYGPSVNSTKKTRFDSSDTGVLKTNDAKALISIAEDPNTWKAVALSANKIIDAQIADQSQSLTTEEQIKALEKKKKLIDEEIALQQKINDNLKKQQDYLVSQTDLQNQIKMARAGGDFLKVGLLQQQLAAKQQEYNAPQALSSLEKQSKLYADAIQKLQDASAAAQQSVAQASIKALQDQKIKPGEMNAFAQGMIDSFKTSLNSQGQVSVVGNTVTVMQAKQPTAKEITAEAKNSYKLSNSGRGGGNLRWLEGESRVNENAWVTFKVGEFTYAYERNGKDPKVYQVTDNGVDRITLGSVVPNQKAPSARAEGGHITGPGTGTSDSIPAYLSNGEYVIKASAVKQYGKGFFDNVNAQKFAGGGKVDNHATNMYEAYQYPKIGNLDKINPQNRMDHFLNRNIMHPTLLWLDRLISGGSGQNPMMKDNLKELENLSKLSTKDQIKYLGLQTGLDIAGTLPVEKGLSFLGKSALTKTGLLDPIRTVHAASEQPIKLNPNFASSKIIKNIERSAGEIARKNDRIVPTQHSGNVNYQSLYLQDSSDFGLAHQKYWGRAYNILVNEKNPEITGLSKEDFFKKIIENSPGHLSSYGTGRFAGEKSLPQPVTNFIKAANQAYLKAHGLNPNQPISMFRASVDNTKKFLDSGGYYSLDSKMAAKYVHHITRGAGTGRGNANNPLAGLYRAIVNPETFHSPIGLGGMWDEYATVFHPDQITNFTKIGNGVKRNPFDDFSNSSSLAAQRGAEPNQFYQFPNFKLPKINMDQADEFFGIKNLGLSAYDIKPIIKKISDGSFTINTGQLQRLIADRTDTKGLKVLQAFLNLEKKLGITTMIPRLPKFHSGGMVPGEYGQEMLAMLQGGEVVLPKELGKRNSSYPSSSIMDSISNNNVTNHFDVTINVPNTSANAQEIAQVVMRTIKTQQDKVYTTGRVI